MPTEWQRVLTGDGERGVAGAARAQRVAGRAPVHAGVALFAAENHAEEEQVAAGKHDSVATGAARASDAARADNELAVAVPLDNRGRVPIGGALERHGIVARHRHVARVLRDARSSRRTCN